MTTEKKCKNCHQLIGIGDEVFFGDYCPLCAELRDKFAAAVLNGLLAEGGDLISTGPLHLWMDNAARDAYNLADAMLEVRKTKTEDR